MRLVWIIRWKDMEGWHYHPTNFTSFTAAQTTANQLDVAWPIDLMPELRAE